MSQIFQFISEILQRIIIIIIIIIDVVVIPPLLTQGPNLELNTLLHWSSPCCLQFMDFSFQVVSWASHCSWDGYCPCHPLGTCWLFFISRLQLLHAWLPSDSQTSLSSECCLLAAAKLGKACTGSQKILVFWEFPANECWVQGCEAIYITSSWDKFRGMVHIPELSSWLG